MIAWLLGGLLSVISIPVLAFQAMIFSTISLVDKEWRFPVAVAWSAFTLWAVWFPPLVLLQLAVIWGTYLYRDEDDGGREMVRRWLGAPGDRPTDRQATVKREKFHLHMEEGSAHRARGVH